MLCGGGCCENAGVQQKIFRFRRSLCIKDEAENAQLPPFSMVYHPGETDEHFSGKQEIIYWFNNGTLKDFEYDDTLDKNQKISVDSFEKNFLKSEDKWEKWLENFNHSIEYCNYNYSSSFGK